MSVHEIEMNRKPVRIPREQIRPKSEDVYFNEHAIGLLVILVRRYPQKAKELLEKELSKTAA